MAISATGFATPLPPEDAFHEASRRLRRLRTLAWFFDQSIPIGRWRIGVDPIIGLLPGVGDWIGGVVSCYVVYEAARLGLPAPILARMGLNILTETLLGSVPVLGDVFDFAWKANVRNLALVERHYRPEHSPRPLRRITWALSLFVLFFLLLVAALGYFVFTGILAVFERL